MTILNEGVAILKLVILHAQKLILQEKFFFYIEKVADIRMQKYEN